MARWNTIPRYTLLALAVVMLSGNSVFAESSERQIYQVAQNVPGLDTLDSGSGSLGGEEKKPVIDISEEGKKRYEKANSIQAKELLSTTGDLGDDARTLVPYEQFFTAGLCGR